MMIMIPEELVEHAITQRDVYPMDDYMARTRDPLGPHPWQPYTKSADPRWEYLNNQPCGFNGCGTSKTSPVHYV